MPKYGHYSTHSKKIAAVASTLQSFREGRPSPEIKGLPLSSSDLPPAHVWPISNVANEATVHTTITRWLESPGGQEVALFHVRGLVPLTEIADISRLKRTFDVAALVGKVLADHPLLMDRPIEVDQQITPIHPGHETPFGSAIETARGAVQQLRAHDVNSVIGFAAIAPPSCVGSYFSSLQS